MLDSFMNASVNLPLELISTIYSIDLLAMAQPSASSEAKELVVNDAQIQPTLRARRLKRS